MSSIALGALPRIVPPRQARSRETMDRVLAAFTELLREKPFERITMAELAQNAQASLPSIYARFKDKDALLLAVHEQFKIASEARIDRQFEEAARSRAAIDSIFDSLAGRLCRNYVRERWLLRSALLSNNPIIYERAALLARRYSERMAFLIKTRLPRARTSVIEQEADFAVRAAFALLQQELAFAGIAPSRFELTETEMRARAGSLFKQAYRSCARDK